MSEKKVTTENSSPSRAKIVFPFVVLLSFAFVLISMIGLFGKVLKGVFLGAFGFAGYAIFSAAIVLYVLSLIGVFKNKIKARTVVYTVLLAFIFLVYLQIMTSRAEFGAPDMTFSAYVKACYAAGIKTSGGVVFSLPAYPLLSLMGWYSAIPVAVLFFLVLFFALLPFMKEGASRSSSDASETSLKGAKRAPSSDKKDSELLLFVDKVRPGQKDAKKIKMKGLFAKKGPEPEFFDYSDTRPLDASAGVVPEPQPTRYDAFERARNDTAVYGDNAYSSASTSYTSDISGDPDEEIPAFVRRYAGERAQANRALYGDEALSRIPDEPRFDLGGSTAPQDQASASAPQEPLKPLTPVQPVVRTTPRTDGIIESMSDLERLRKKGSAPTATTFIGEDGFRPEPSVAPRPVEPVRSAETPRESVAPSQSFDLPEEPVDREERTILPDPAPAPALSRSQEPTTITPREASSLTPEESVPYTPPVENKPSKEASSRRPIAVVEREEEPPVLPIQPTRKPRSDIGGTHRTRDEEVLPKKEMTQMNIDQLEAESEPPARPYTPPPVSLLTEYPPIQDDDGVEERGARLVEALASFHIRSEVLDHKTGPTFTQYAITLPDNMSVNKITPLAMDIKRKLMVEKNIRIIPSVPGLDAVGVEVANTKSSMVGLRSIISSPIFAKEGKLYFAIGVNVSGQAVYGDMLKMPHLLVAGSTGSGKSVALNALIISIMYHYSPEFVRFIMVDPKQVELSVYEGMPHMLLPGTVTSADKAVNALTWAVNEMERRYQLLRENRCHNLGEYNALMKKQGKKGLYYVVFIVDEMADLMSAAKREVEERIGRLVAKARAAGIHLVIATQRPSVDVLTGVIKNNIPTRIAFKVTSFTDSKTILDRGGAETLFGNGDMLYTPPEGGDPIRLQGPYINEEIESIVNFIKENNDARYDREAEKQIQAEKEPQVETKSDQDAAEDDGEDPLFASALLYFINIGQASISKLQIKYRIGYGRAARIVETMAERGYLGPSEGGNKSRQVIISLDEYYQLYGEYPDGGEE